MDKILISMKVVICILYITLRSSSNKLRNKRMRAYNGNNFQRQISFFHQNVPGKTKSPADQICEIETVISKLCPDVLIVSEADTNLVCNWDYPGYKSFRGHLKGGSLVRVSAVVKASLLPVVTHLDVEVPNVVISFKIDHQQYRCTGVYREWNFSGKKSAMKDQEVRWTLFEDAEGSHGHCGPGAEHHHQARHCQVDEQLPRGEAGG